MKDRLFLVTMAIIFSEGASLKNQPKMKGKAGFSYQEYSL